MKYSRVLTGPQHPSLSRAVSTLITQWRWLVFHPRILKHILRSALAAMILCLSPQALSAPTAESFRLPSTPGGLDPLQCWYALGSTPDGSIYIAASDHKTNSALFEKRTDDQVFRYVGDAQQASIQVDN